MNILYPAGAKREWFDRNPVVSSKMYQGGAVAPHSTTQRWTYTVPAGKRVFINLLYIHMFRDGTPGTPSLASAWVAINDGVNTYECGSIKTVSGTLGYAEGLVVPGFGFLTAGQIIASNTYDNSTGGTFSYRLNMSYVEFDA